MENFIFKHNILLLSVKQNKPFHVRFVILFLICDVKADIESQLNR